MLEESLRKFFFFFFYNFPMKSSSTAYNDPMDTFWVEKLSSRWAKHLQLYNRSPVVFVFLTFSFFKLILNWRTENLHQQILLSLQQSCSAPSELALQLLCILWFAPLCCIKKHKLNRTVSKLALSGWRWRCAATCSWCVWLKGSEWMQTTLAASSAWRVETWDAACCSCSSGSTVGEDVPLRSSEKNSHSVCFYFLLIVFHLFSKTTLQHFFSLQIQKLAQEVVQTHSFLWFKQVVLPTC